MRKERASYENISKGKNIKKSIIKRINDSALNKNIRTIESQIVKKVHLNLNNDSNTYYNRTIELLSSQNNYNDDFIHNEKLNNIFLEKIIIYSIAIEQEIKLLIFIKIMKIF